MTPNQKAFLDMLAVSEGTAGRGNGGYNVIVGGGLFTSYADHPNVLVDLGRGLKSTAAGRYQLLYRYWKVYKAQLGLADFSPASQDAVALQQIAECRALDDIAAGDIGTAISKCAHIWASLPGAGYGQRENNLATLITAFTRAGGTMA